MKRIKLESLFPDLSPRSALWLAITYGLKRKSLTYRKLGALTGITHTYLVAVAKGHKKITPRVVEQLKKTLEIDLSMFL